MSITWRSAWRRSITPRNASATVPRVESYATNNVKQERAVGSDDTH
jgi:hypothetical protein